MCDVAVRTTTIASIEIGSHPSHTLRHKRHFPLMPNARMRASFGCRLASWYLLVAGITRITEAFLPTAGPSLYPIATTSSVAVQQQRYCRSQSPIIPGHISVARECAICHARKKDKERCNNNDHVPGPSQSQPTKRSLRRRLRRWAVSLAFVTSALRYANRPAHAKFSYELQETPTHSLRPGMNKQQAEDLQEGKIQVSDVEASSIFQKEKQKQEAPSSSSKTQTAKQSKQQKKKSASTFGYGEEDEFGDEDDDEDDFAALSPSSAATARQTDQDIAERLQSQTTRQFAAKHRGKSQALYVKVGIAFFVPTYGTLIVREYVRRRREEAYVQKGLEILEAQKAEYFNVTNTTPDSDVEDELKGLKKNETKTDDDDDDDGDDEDDDNDGDDNDDDDDNEPPPPRGGKPRRPRGDGPKTGGGAGSGADSKDPGYGKPSDEDLDKLNRMFGRS